MLSERMVCSALKGNTNYCMLLIESPGVYQILRDISLLSGYSTRGAEPLAESLVSLEAADRAADRRGGETDGFGQSVPAQAASQDNDTVEGQQHRDTRQVRQQIADEVFE